MYRNRKTYSVMASFFNSEKVYKVGPMRMARSQKITTIPKLFLPPSIILSPLFNTKKTEKMQIALFEMQIARRVSSNLLGRFVYNSVKDANDLFKRQDWAERFDIKDP